MTNIWDVNPFVDNAVDLTLGIEFEICTTNGTSYTVQGCWDEDQYLDESGIHATLQSRIEVSIQSIYVPPEVSNAFVRVSDSRLPDMNDQWYRVNYSDDPKYGRTNLILVKTCDNPKENTKDVCRSTRTVKSVSSNGGARSKR